MVLLSITEDTEIIPDENNTLWSDVAEMLLYKINQIKLDQS